MRSKLCMKKHKKKQLQKLNISLIFVLLCKKHEKEIAIIN